VVSVLFADLVGFTAAGDGADPEDIRRRLSPYQEAIRQEVERHGGRIEKLMGDGVLAVFGAPVSHEDDAERAVRAGLRIQERVASMATEGRMRARVAVGTGEVMVALEGTTMDREGLVGDVVNTTSRLQNEAPPGAVLVDEPTRRLTRRAIEYEERPPVQVKGKRELLRVWVATAPIGRTGAHLEGEQASLVDRESELRLLIDAFTRGVRDRAGQIVTIAGEPGVGKSRLVRELRRHVDQLPDLVRWRQARCPPYGEAASYSALGELVKAEAGILDTDAPGTALGRLAVSLEPLLPGADERAWVVGRLAPLVGSGSERATGKGERFAAWHRWLTALAEQRPTVVVVEDLQWADALLVEFLSEAPETARGAPLLLVCTARPEFFESFPHWGTGLRDALTIRLQTLDAEGTAHLLGELLAGEELDEGVRRLVAERSGGNPLWAEEFVRMLRDRPPDAGALAIPGSVQAIVAARIDLLDPAAKTVIQAASTVGKAFWASAVADLAEGTADIAESLQELVRRGLIRRERVSTVPGETEYSFTHTVVREVAARQAPRTVRAVRHHRVARWMERMAGDRVADRAELIAHHDGEALRLATATDLPDVTMFVEAAIGSYQRAAAQAACLDVAAQCSYLEAALALTPQGDRRRGRILLAIGEARFRLGLADRAVKELLEARQELDLIDDVEGWGLATGVLAHCAWERGEPDAGERYLAEAVDRLQQSAPGPALAAVFSLEARRLALRGSALAEGLALVERVRPTVEAHGDSRARRQLLSAEGGIRFDAGDPGGIESLRRALGIAIEANDSDGMATAYNNLGWALRIGWGAREAVPVLQQGLEVATQRRLGGMEEWLHVQLGFVRFGMGRWDEAEAHLQAARARAERLPYLEAVLQGGMLMTAACRGHAPRDADSQVAALLAITDTLKDLQIVVPMCDLAAWIYLALGDDEAALGCVRRTIDLSGATPFLLCAGSMVLWMLRRAGELDRIVPLLPGLRRFDMPRPRRQITIAEALLEEQYAPAIALTRIVEAADGLADLGEATDAVAALAEGVRIAAELGDRGRAAALRRRACDLLAGARGESLLARLGL